MIAKRDKQGKSLKILARDYCAVSIETTDLTPSSGEIIEISVVRYRDLKKTEQYKTFVKPERMISDLAVGFTGISNETVADAPDISKAILDFYDFVQDDIIIGYNINFDINFLYDALLECHGIALSNDFVDVQSFTRIALPTFERRSQSRIAKYFHITVSGVDRPEKDCEICSAIYQKMMTKWNVIEWLEKNGQGAPAGDSRGRS